MGLLSVCHRVQTGHEAQLASCPMGTWDCNPDGIAAGAWSWSHTSV